MVAKVPTRRNRTADKTINITASETEFLTHFFFMNIKEPAGRPKRKISESKTINEPVLDASKNRNANIM